VPYQCRSPGNKNISAQNVPRFNAGTAQTYWPAFLFAHAKIARRATKAAGRERRAPRRVFEHGFRNPRRDREVFDPVTTAGLPCGQSFLPEICHD
jgi:hypothetical protein